MISFKANYLPKAVSLNIITLEDGASIYDWETYNSVHSNAYI